MPDEGVAVDHLVVLLGELNDLPTGAKLKLPGDGWTVSHFMWFSAVSELKWVRARLA